MKYTCEIEINAPLEKVVALWEDENYFDQWQDGFKSIELLYGEKNSVGAQSKIIFEQKQRIELIETIVSYNLPHEKEALYEHIHMTNTQISRFKDLGNQKTLYISEVEYLKFNGFIMKAIAKMFSSKFKAQSEKWMKQFKVFVENEI